jgi:hypothetical protein
MAAYLETLNEMTPRLSLVLRLGVPRVAGLARSASWAWAGSSPAHSTPPRRPEPRTRRDRLGDAPDPDQCGKTQCPAGPLRRPVSRPLTCGPAPGSLTPVAKLAMGSPASPARPGSTERRRRRLPGGCGAQLAPKGGVLDRPPRGSHDRHARLRPDAFGAGCLGHFGVAGSFPNTSAGDDASASPTAADRAAIGPRPGLQTSFGMLEIGRVAPTGAGLAVVALGREPDRHNRRCR